ncbi:MAG: ribosomal protein S18-alanine N-acetyltransferase [Pseudomonadota bacterium]|uniref:ribosomal protein S18-alanine N-acetyltransferase n=1 Tax=Thermithiobacillus tepidarius TaxID=929 RepID=UPI0004034EDB|nr:ribosomal protein S18-alanine N-acetyltransferase [Thermithiobacillus tepidarius]
MELRPMRMEDLDAVARLEAAICITPWSLGIFRDCLLSGYEGWVFATPEGMIVAYGVLSAAAGEAHLLNLGVAQTHRGQGLGRRLTEHLIGRARALHAHILFLEVRVSNRIAQSLYKSAGFRQIGMRKGYYRDLSGREDALVLALRLERAERRPLAE